jgi:hypothetical protein
MATETVTGLYVASHANCINRDRAKGGGEEREGRESKQVEKLGCGHLSWSRALMKGIRRRSEDAISLGCEDVKSVRARQAGDK